MKRITRRLSLSCNGPVSCHGGLKNRRVSVCVRLAGRRSQRCPCWGVRVQTSVAGGCLLCVCSGVSLMHSSVTSSPWFSVFHDTRPIALIPVLARWPTWFFGRNEELWLRLAFAHSCTKVWLFQEGKIEGKEAVRQRLQWGSGTSRNSSTGLQTVHRQTTHTHTHTTAQQPAFQSQGSPSLQALLPSVFIGLFIICTASTLQLKVDYLWTPLGTGGESRHPEMCRNKVLPLAAFSTLPPPR